jgi:aminoglycoside phosphotransferase (APT) family kinase protein
MLSAEHDIDIELVAGLLGDQHADLVDLPLRHLAHGWDNESFRLGDDLMVRLPRRHAAAELIVNEQRWLGDLARMVRLPIPAPLRIGHAGRGYPWSW